MTNKTYFPTDTCFRSALGLAVNRIVQFNTQLLITERDDEIVSAILGDVARINDISVNFIGFGSITDVDISWLIEAHDRMELWHNSNHRDSNVAILEGAK